MPLSALFGGIAGGPLIEIIGRKTTILTTAVPFIICKYDVLDKCHLDNAFTFLT
jgi:hypothetical protein